MTSAKRLESFAQWTDLAAVSRYRVGEFTKESTREFQISRRTLEVFFRKQTGHSPRQWLDLVRTVMAVRFLIEGKAPKATWIDLGYRDGSHFYHQFKRYLVLTPGEFIDRCGTAQVLITLLQVVASGNRSLASTTHRLETLVSIIRHVKTQQNVSIKIPI
jgi:AraC-like DNA-binding protein